MTEPVGVNENLGGRVEGTRGGPPTNRALLPSHELIKMHRSGIISCLSPLTDDITPTLIKYNQDRI